MESKFEPDIQKILLFQSFNPTAYPVELRVCLEMISYVHDYVFINTPTYIAHMLCVRRTMETPDTRQG